MIGVGVAGVAAAIELALSGQKATVLEAHDEFKRI